MVSMGGRLLDLVCLIAAAAALAGVAACSSSGGDDGGDQGRGDGGSVGAIDAASPVDARPPPVCPGEADVSFASDVQPILTAGCVDTACHDSTGSAAHLDLTEGKAYAALVGATAFQCDRARVVPGDLDESYLVSKLTGNGMCSGTLMPKADMSLSDEELDLVFGWICAGAADD
jgi:hypothetical protein